MTFEETDTRAPETAADERPAPVRRRHVFLPRDTDLDKMMRFITKTETIATNLRGLAALFKGVFIEGDVDLTDAQSGATDIIEECLLSIAKRLDDNAAQAQQVKLHLEAGGAR